MIHYSIIIPTYNGAERLVTTLDAILRQSIQSSMYEILIIDDGSVDQTEKVVTNYIKSHSQKNIIYKKNEERKGPAGARNSGIRIARGEILFFLDDDCDPPALWIEKFISIYQKYPDIVGIGGWYSASSDCLQKNIFEQFIYIRYRFLWGEGLDYAHGKTGELKPLPAANGGNFSVKKWIFNYTGLYNSRFHFAGGMEDVEISKRIQDKGFILYYVPLFMIHKKQINSFFKFLKFCMSRAKATKIFNSLYGLNNHPTAASAYNRFVTYCHHLKKHELPFRYNKHILLLAFIYFYLNDFILYLPFSYERKNR